MSRIRHTLLAVLLLGACAHLPAADTGARQRALLWTEAHQALSAGEFGGARERFTELNRRFPESQEGSEALFYIGALHLDPRNPEWDPQPAVPALRSYLAADESGRAGPPPARRPEATTLLALADQLTIPPEERVEGLRPETRVVRVPGERVVVTAAESRALEEEAERLRREVAERDEQIRRLREELERIRRTLTPRPQPQPQ